MSLLGPNDDDRAYAEGYTLSRMEADAKEIARLTRERDEALARERVALAAEDQLAALLEAARELMERAGTMYEFASDSYPENEADLFLAAWKTVSDALTDAAPAAEAYTRRVQAEALRRAADMCDASTVNGDVDCSIAEVIRAEAERIEGGGS